MYLKLIDHIHICFQKKWIYLFWAFFFFFMGETSFTIGTTLYCKSKNMEYLWGMILTVSQISLVVMPILVTRMSVRYGNVRVAKWSTLLLSFFFFFTFFIDSAFFGIFFIFPFFLRVFNNSLTPYISKTSHPRERGVVFAMRDVFLYEGMALGLMISSILSLENFVLTQVMKVSGFLFFISSFFLWKHPNTKPKIIQNFVKTPLFSFPWKEIQHKKNAFIFIFLFSGVSWIGMTITFLPMYISSFGFQSSEIFSSYALSYFIVPLLGVFSAIIAKGGKKGWYIFDLFFDIIPLILICTAVSFFQITLAVVLIQFKDFVKPTSLAYFFDCFYKEEADHVWGLIASTSALIGILSPMLISYLFQKNPISIFLISIFLVPILTLVAFVFLPQKVDAKEGIASAPKT